MTNYDWIKSMNIGGMANIIMCPNDLGLAEIECDKSDSCNCYECCKKFLESEVDSNA